MRKQQKTVRVSPSLCAFKQYYSAQGEVKSFVLADNGLRSTLSQEKIDTYRNGAAHTSVFTHQRAHESFNFVIDALTRMINGWSEYQSSLIEISRTKPVV